MQFICRGVCFCLFKTIQLDKSPNSPAVESIFGLNVIFFPQKFLCPLYLEILKCRQSASQKADGCRVPPWVGASYVVNILLIKYVGVLPYQRPPPPPKKSRIHWMKIALTVQCVFPKLVFNCLLRSHEGKGSIHDVLFNSTFIFF